MYAELSSSLIQIEPRNFLKNDADAQTQWQTTKLNIRSRWCLVLIDFRKTF